MNSSAGQGHAGDRVEAVIVNWNTGAYLRRCLDSLFAHHRGHNLSVVVVDNASSDGSEEVARSAERVTLIQNSTNRGFAAAVNQALESLQADTRYVLVLNPDVEFTGDVLGPLLEFISARDDTGILTPRLTNPDGSMQASCRRREPSLWNMLSHRAGQS